MDAPVVSDATGWQLLGAGCFGAVIGWLVYALQRHRQGVPTVRATGRSRCRSSSGSTSCRRASAELVAFSLASGVEK